MRVKVPGQFSRLLRRVAAGEEITIANRGLPVARLVPVSAERPMRKLGISGDTIKISDDFDAPLPSEILDAFAGRPRRKKEVMKYVVDTSVLIHSLISQPKLNDRALTLLADGSSELFLSALRSWEITIKARTARLVLRERSAEFVTRAIQVLSLRPLDITHLHALAVDELPEHQGDPFDSLLVAQASANG